MPAIADRLHDAQLPSIPISVADANGIERDIARAFISNGWVGSAAFTRAGFSAEDRCSRVTYGEDLIPSHNSLPGSIAGSGTYGSLDSVRRGLQASVLPMPLRVVSARCNPGIVFIYQIVFCQY